MKHNPVMINEVIEFLNPQKGKVYIDATLGDGGYTKAILEKNPEIEVIAIEQNSESLERAKVNLKDFQDKIIFVHDNFKNIKDVANGLGYLEISGVVYDLGLASWQIEKSNIGITFSKNEPLDMRLDDSKKNLTTASEILNKFSAKKIADILYKYGDVRKSWAVARRIEISRTRQPIIYTNDLIEILGTKNPKILAPVFQALRIYVNQELENLTKSLDGAMELVEDGGKIIVVSFHSGEDRIVKNIFRERKGNKKDIKILTKKPVLPSFEEIALNSRARSAKLRALEKVK